MPDQLDPINADLSADSAVGILAVAQLNGSPYMLRLLIQTRQIDAAAGGLLPQNNYMIDISNVVEHELTLGPFNQISLLDDHPLLIHHRAPRVNIYITGTSDDIQAVQADLIQAHDEVFQGWRNASMDLNRAVPLDQLFKRGYGLLGEMPLPLADAVSTVLTRHGVAHNMIPSETPGKRAWLLLIDESFIIGGQITVQNIAELQENERAES